MKEKAYAKVIFALKIISEAVQRLLLEKFIEETNAEIGNPAALLDLVQDCSRDKLKRSFYTNLGWEVFEA